MQKQMEEKSLVPVFEKMAKKYNVGVEEMIERYSQFLATVVFKHEDGLSRIIEDPKATEAILEELYSRQTPSS
jgi:hypothetical protein